MEWKALNEIHTIIQLIEPNSPLYMFDVIFLSEI